jgi:hypothetical protein
MYKESLVEITSKKEAETISKEFHDKLMNIFSVTT